MARIITLCTDFCTADGYAGAIKGVVLSIAPQARLVDITHQVPRQSVRHGARTLLTACPYYPQGTIHLVVVDPGVGSERRAVAVRSAGQFYVAPDNGVLSEVLPMEGPEEAVALTNRAYWRQQVSATFHGRDIFAPAAAHLANGTPLSELGESIDDLKRLPRGEPVRRRDGSMVGHVAHVDVFGNLITDIPAEWLMDRHGEEKGWRIGVAGTTIEGLTQAYAAAEPGELLALIGSHDHLELAVREGSAAEATGAKVDDVVEARPTDTPADREAKQ
jgi:hypothetical protein